MSSSFAIPSGIISSRLDLELFGVVLIALLVSVIPVSINDHEWRHKFRPVEYLESWPFDWSRVGAAWLALFILGALTFIFLLGGSSILSTTLFMFVFAILGPLFWQIVYGYGSQIMLFFGRSLAFAPIPALWLNWLLMFRVSRAAEFTIAAAVAAAAVAWGTLFFIAMARIQAEDQEKVLVRPQRPWHSVYLAILGGGHFVIYMAAVVYPLANAGLLPGK
jgi:hypothetical protein